MNNLAADSSRLVFLISVFLAVLCNFAFFRNVAAVYPLTFDKLPFLCSLSLVLVCLTALMLMIFSAKCILKPVLILVLVASSLASYFMSTFNVIIDADMLRNTMRRMPPKPWTC